MASEAVVTASVGTKNKRLLLGELRATKGLLCVSDLGSRGRPPPADF